VNGTQGLGFDIALLGFGVVFLALAVVTGTVSLVRRGRSHPDPDHR
jgi:hypothetical protein